jgi:hypothetical protein
MVQQAEVHGRRIESKSLHLRIPTQLWERVWRLASIHNRTFNNMAETLLQYATEVAEKQGEEESAAAVAEEPTS